MKLTEAKEIVGWMIDCHMYHMEVSDKRPENRDYSLEQMIEANKRVEQFNEWNRQKSEKELAESGKSVGRKVLMTVADRGIAAIYVCMNYQGNVGENMESLAYANGNYLFSLHERNIKNRGH